MNRTLIVDLYLVKRLEPETPGRSFHQLMYCLYPSPVDRSLVCGRLGVLSSLKTSYARATFEMFSYFPTYFREPDLAIVDDGLIFSGVGASEKDLKKHIRGETLHGRGETAKELNTSATRAMARAIEERIAGIFRVPVPLDATGPDAETSWPVIAKGEKLSIGVERLTKRIRKTLGGE